MNPMVDPNVGYTLLVGGVLLAILALFVPGTGLLELGAFAALFAAGYILMTLPFNAWALAVMLVALVPLFFAIRWRRGRGGWVLLGGAMAVMFAGSIYVFRTPGGAPAVNPLVALAVTGGSAGLVWLMARKTLEAIQLGPRHNPERVVGARGEARTDLSPLGSVYVLGENWSARCQGSIPKGSLVRVIQRDGLILDVEWIRTEE